MSFFSKREDDEDRRRPNESDEIGTGYNDEQQGYNKDTSDDYSNTGEFESYEGGLKKKPSNIEDSEGEFGTGSDNFARKKTGNIDDEYGGVGDENTRIGYGRKEKLTGDENDYTGTDDKPSDEFTTNDSEEAVTPDPYSGEEERKEKLEDAEGEVEEHRRHQRMGMVGTLAAGAVAAYEAHEAEVDPEDGTRHKVEAGIAAAVATGAGGYSVYEHHKKEEFKDNVEELEEEAEGGKKKHGWFG